LLGKIWIAVITERKNIAVSAEWTINASSKGNRNVGKIIATMNAAGTNSQAACIFQNRDCLKGAACISGFSIENVKMQNI
jgi:hypothetical protein